MKNVTVEFQTRSTDPWWLIQEDIEMLLEEGKYQAEDITIIVGDEIPPEGK